MSHIEHLPLIIYIEPNKNTDTSQNYFHGYLFIIKTGNTVRDLQSKQPNYRAEDNASDANNLTQHDDTNSNSIH